MSIDSTIEKMEETLRKKRALRAERAVAKIAKLRERIKAKAKKRNRLDQELFELESEIVQCESDAADVGTETKTETFVLGAGKESKDPAAKKQTLKN